MLAIVQFIFANGPAFIAAFLGVAVALVALVHAVIAVSMLIPGEQPEKFLQSVLDKLQGAVDFISKYSK